ncbi:FliA/WhiG family RNA polymerase sigma factor [Salisediminibacterium beveridgei]|uniref:RNA polymerase sigma factor SigD n=1 Tax=Salisediminibacterium beveridgei TaxID=632773 RepID=A0A1D7QVX2_9BACI|nr:FliA/WhiG family RNA polymerase sigma factor [Salisediminibacterium beveridgei]AOM83161.1 RNA polymerase sigma factor SigD [Salisediminibacterium beveridgei]
MSRLSFTAQLDKDWKSWTSSRDRSAGNRLIEAYMPLVDYHVQRIGIHLPKNVSHDDLRSHGLMGLYDALEKFDLKRELKFDTYASFRVRGAIIDGLRQEDWLPRTLRDKAKKIEQVTETLEQQLGRNVTAMEIADETGMTENEVIRTSNESYFSHRLSIDEPTQDDDQTETYASSIADQQSLTPAESLSKQSDYAELAEAIQTLNEKEQLVITLFYYEELTLTEIGEALSLSTSRISQIHSKSVFKLQQQLKSGR